jgi:hypothetical protein
MADLSAIAGSRLPAYSFHRTLQLLDVRSEPTRMEACMVNLIRLSDKTAIEWELARNQVVDQVNAQADARPGMVMIGAFYCAIRAADHIEDTIESLHRALLFKAALMENDQLRRRIRRVRFPQQRQVDHVRVLRNRIVHRGKKLLKPGAAGTGPPFVRVEQNRVVIGDLWIRHSAALLTGHNPLEWFALGLAAIFMLGVALMVLLFLWGVMLWRGFTGAP